MPDNVLETLHHAIQDVIAPDVRELKVRVSSIERQMETQYTSLRAEMQPNTRLRETSRTQTSKRSWRLSASRRRKATLTPSGSSLHFTERVAALESARQ